MAFRNIINIDEDKCNGCGQCIVDCVEAALQIVDGKARLVKEIYCDGLGACLGSCPTGALSVVQRESDPFDEEATHRHMEAVKTKEAGFQGCPGTRPVDFSEKPAAAPTTAEIKPELTNWPVQLKLVATKAPYFEDADLLLAADCTAFSTINFQSRFVKGRKLLIACPKLDDAQYYYEKLTEIFAENAIRGVTVLRMEVPCCGGLSYLVKQAIQASKKDLPYHEVVIGIKGDIVAEGKMPMPKLQPVSRE
jgi:Pyruvate/2-oxoacid:ferredoxin oxidoreductase delta subunit